MTIFHLLGMAAFSLVSALSGVVGLLLTLSLVKATVTEPRSFEFFEARLRHYTDRLVVNPDGTFSIIKTLHPVLVVLALWMATIVIFIAAVYMLRRIARGRLMYGGPVSPL
jgi:ABC-type antimicrobial peptide transport system permease subunit